MPRWRIAAGALIGFASACAASTAPPPPAEPPARPSIAPPPVASSPPVTVPAEPETADAGPSDTDAAPSTTTGVEPEQAPGSDSIGRSQRPIDVLTARDAAFLVNYASSEAKQKAEAACARDAEDPQKKAACLTEAREKFLPDVLRFRKDSETQLSLLVYQRAGSSLRELWVGGITLEETSADSVRLKFVGRGRGTRPLWRGKTEVELRVPTDYELELDDPELGRLRYDAKVGLVSE